MFDRRGLIWALGLLGSPLAAQDMSVTRLQRQADSLAAEWRTANAIATVAESLERERAVGSRDTIAVGALRIIANRSPLPLREAAARVWPVLESVYGSAAQALVERPYYILAIDPDTVTSRPVVHVGFDVPWNLGVDDLALLLLANVPIEPPDDVLKNWLQRPLRPRIDANRDFARIYVRLVTAASASARQCFLGDIPSCRSVLGLDSSPHSPLPPDTIPPSFAADARHLLAHTALRLGGRDSYTRLISDSAMTLSERLSNAAGVELDTVVARWRDEVIAARPTSVALPPWGALSALGWVLVLGVCGIRSSRWRVR